MTFRNRRLRNTLAVQAFSAVALVCGACSDLSEMLGTQKNPRVTPAEDLSAPETLCSKTFANEEFKNLLLSGMLSHAAYIQTGTQDTIDLIKFALELAGGEIDSTNARIQRVRFADFGYSFGEDSKPLGFKLVSIRIWRYLMGSYPIKYRQKKFFYSRP